MENTEQTHIAEKEYARREGQEESQERQQKKEQTDRSRNGEVGNEEECLSKQLIPVITLHIITTGQY